MADSGGLVVQVQPGDSDDADELAKLTVWLRDELLDLDVAAVDPLEDQDIPAGAKGAAAVAGWLAVNLGPEALKQVITKIADWAVRNNRGLKVTIDGDTLELPYATPEQRQEVIDVWLARHQSRS